ncbi:MAG: NAD(P)-dependent oxidoreductase, partial [Oxalobacteraceae bacterium]
MTVANPSKKIAFLGTGLMGAPMARRLLQAGYSLTVWNRNPDKAKALESDGATVAPSPAEAVDGADIVITMLTDGKAVGDVLFESGCAERLAKGAKVIDMSSIAPAIAKEHSAKLGELGIAHVDAPVSG